LSETLKPIAFLDRIEGKAHLQAAGKQQASSRQAAGKQQAQASSKRKQAAGKQQASRTNRQRRHPPRRHHTCMIDPSAGSDELNQEGEGGGGKGSKQ
jgi:hypothetical protein